MVYRLQTWLSLIVSVLLIASCSKESLEDTTDGDTAECTFPAPAADCSVVFLQGSSGWTEIIDPGELEDPYFLYSPGSMSPRGTVTVSLQNGNVLVRINDSEVKDLRVEVAQQDDGEESVCKVLTDIDGSGSEDAADAMVNLQGTFQYPFHLKIKANECL